MSNVRRKRLRFKKPGTLSKRLAGSSDDTRRGRLSAAFFPSKRRPGRVKQRMEQPVQQKESRETVECAIGLLLVCGRKFLHSMELCCKQSNPICPDAPQAPWLAVCFSWRTPSVLCEGVMASGAQYFIRARTGSGLIRAWNRRDRNLSCETHFRNCSRRNQSSSHHGPTRTAKVKGKKDGAQLRGSKRSKSGLGTQVLWL